MILLDQLFSFCNLSRFSVSRGSPPKALVPNISHKDVARNSTTQRRTLALKNNHLHALIFL